MRQFLSCGSCLLLLLTAVPAWAQEAQDDGDLNDVRMEVVGEPDAGEREFVEEIRLPETAAPEARDNAAFGLDTANEARQRAADEAAEFGRSVAREAREARESGRDADNARRAIEGANEGPPGRRPIDVP